MELLKTEPTECEKRYFGLLTFDDNTPTDVLEDFKIKFMTNELLLLESNNDRTLVNALSQVRAKQKQANDQYKKDSEQLQKYLGENRALESEVKNLRKIQRSGQEQMDNLLRKMETLCLNTDNTRFFLENLIPMVAVQSDNPPMVGTQSENPGAFSRRDSFHVSGRGSYRSDASSGRGTSKERDFHLQEQGRIPRHIKDSKIAGSVGSAMSEVTATPQHSQNMSPQSSQTSSSDESADELLDGSPVSRFSVETQTRMGRRASKSSTGSQTELDEISTANFFSPLPDDRRN